MKTKKIKAKIKKNNWTNPKSTGSERERNPSPEDRLKADEDGIVFDRDALMDKQRLAERAQDQGKKEAITETAKLDKTRA